MKRFTVQRLTQLRQVIDLPVETVACHASQMNDVLIHYPDLTKLYAQYVTFCNRARAGVACAFFSVVSRSSRLAGVMDGLFAWESDHYFRGLPAKA